MNESLKPPTSYADWVRCFELLTIGEQDEELLELIRNGKVPWTKGIAERFVEKMAVAVSRRLQYAVDDFSKQLGRANGEENAIVQAILALRRRSQYLLRLVATPIFPEEVRTKFTEEIEKNLNQLQDVLKEEGKKDPSGRLVRVIQHTPIIVHVQLLTQETPKPIGKIKRRIIFE